MRPAIPGDAVPLAAMLNRIIAAGGTTALEEPFTPERFGEWFIRPGPELAVSHVALDPDTGEPMGFQILERLDRLPAGWADIGTFTRREKPVPGAGRALFAATLVVARKLRVRTINATIRADNAGGLAFYRRLGFSEYARDRGVPLKDGTPVDRVHHRLDV